MTAWSTTGRTDAEGAAGSPVALRITVGVGWRTVAILHYRPQRLSTRSCLGAARRGALAEDAESRDYPRTGGWLTIDESGLKQETSSAAFFGKSGEDCQ